MFVYTDALAQLMSIFLKDVVKGNDFNLCLCILTIHAVSMYSADANVLSLSDPTLTLANLLEISSPLDDKDINILRVPLGQPPLNSSLRSKEKKERLFSGYLESHPAPSWRGVAWALYIVGGGTVSAHKALRKIYERGFLRS